MTLADQDRRSSAVVDVAKGNAGLLVVRGDNVGSRFAIRRDRMTLGRDPKSDVFLSDVTVSRNHCEVIAVTGGHEVRDLESLNGTYVNGERVASARLLHGDELQVGKFKLVFVSS